MVLFNLILLDIRSGMIPGTQLAIPETQLAIPELQLAIPELQLAIPELHFHCGAEIIVRRPKTIILHRASGQTCFGVSRNP